MDLADRAGIESLSMRKLGEALGVEAMSLYTHVANKDAILDAIVDVVVGEIELLQGVDWKVAMRARATSAHRVLLRHPWAPALIESRTNLGPLRLRYFDSVIKALRQGGFSIGAAYNAFLTLDSYIYGFTLQEVSWPFDADEREAVVEAMTPQVAADEYPFVTEIMTYVMSRKPSAKKKKRDYEAEFSFGLELILEGLERAVTRARDAKSG